MSVCAQSYRIRRKYRAHCVNMIHMHIYLCVDTAIIIIYLFERMLPNAAINSMHSLPLRRQNQMAAWQTCLSLSQFYTFDLIKIRRCIYRNVCLWTATKDDWRHPSVAFNIRSAFLSFFFFCSSTLLSLKCWNYRGFVLLIASVMRRVANTKCTQSKRKILNSTISGATLN